MMSATTPDTDASNADVTVQTRPLTNAPSCPKCGGRMWDNRLGKRNPKAPDFKCRDRRCDGVVWPRAHNAARTGDDRSRVVEGAPADTTDRDATGESTRLPHADGLRACYLAVTDFVLAEVRPKYAAAGVSCTGVYGRRDRRHAVHRPVQDARHSDHSREQSRELSRERAGGRTMSPRAPGKDAGAYPAVVGPHAARAARERTRAVRMTTLRLVRDSSFVVTIEVSGGASATGERIPIRSPRDVYELMAPYAAREVGESFWILPLDAQHRLCGGGPTVITRGILNASLVHPREVFLAAIVASAAAVVLVHNHPSGDPTPSPDDRAVTEQLVAAGRLLDIPVHDHLIIGRGRFVSFAEGGLL